MTFNELHGEYMKMCDEQEDCSECKYDGNFPCQLSFGYSKGRADQKEEDNAFFNFEGAWELEKKKVRVDAIDECMRAIVNTESKVVNPCANKTWDELTLLANRQFEILEILEQLKEKNNG